MGAHAARVGDLTAHGTALGPGPGCQTVLVEGSPAWRAEIDIHLCPLRTGGEPHGPGRVISASATVMIGGQPAARQGDALAEATGSNTIVSGAATVLIG
jgi:uncharacterized Zn-binding protein involved in type VI secretion